MTWEMSQLKDNIHWPFCTVYLQQNQCISISCFSRCQYIPETLMQKNNMGIIGYDMRIKEG